MPMPRKKKPPLSFVEKMKKISAAKLNSNKAIEAQVSSADETSIESLELRVKKILGITERNKKSQGKMLFFVMYDIENDKVRRLVSKYLQSKGCTRVQRSIFLAETTANIYEQIRTDLAEVQAAYDNQDSIIVLPVSTDYLRMMKVIGQKIELDIITHSKNTLFF